MPVEAGIAERNTVPPRLLLVGHDAQPNGAQQLLLEIGRELGRRNGIEFEFLLLGGGDLEAAYLNLAPTRCANRLVTYAELEEEARQFAARGFTTALVNTTATSPAVPALTAAGIDSVLLVHEMPGIIREMGFREAARVAVATARHVVFAAPFVRDDVLAELDLPADRRILVRPQGLYKQIATDATAAARVAEELKLAAGARLVLGVGFADMRKGFDQFLQVWRLVDWLRPHEDVHFCWLGEIHPALKECLDKEIAVATATGRFHIPGRRDDVGAFLGLADALLLTSREDPFPSVVIEALAAGVPPIVFDETGGIPDLLRETGTGRVVPYADTPAMAEAVISLQRGEAPELRAMRRRLVAERFGWKSYVDDLVQLALLQHTPDSI